MNRTNYAHGLYALLIQSITTALTGNVWIGAALAIGFFIGREHAQQEYKYAKDVATLKWYAGFTGWSLDKCLDVITPIVAVICFGCVITYW